MNLISSVFLDDVIDVWILKDFVAVWFGLLFFDDPLHLRSLRFGLLSSIELV